MTELERQKLIIRNNRIIDIVIEEIKNKCPLAVDLIGIAGSFCNGDIYENSDLDLVIIVNDKSANLLNKCFILGNVGFDIYTQDWSRFETMAEYNSPYVTKLFDLDIIYTRDDSILGRYSMLQNRVKNNMEDEVNIKNKVAFQFEMLLAYYNKLLNSNNASDGYRAYAMMIKGAEYIIYMLNKTYVKRGTKRVPEEINSMSIVPEGFLKVYNSLMDAANLEEIKIKAFGLVSTIMRFLDRKGISYRKDYSFNGDYNEKQEINSESLTGTYEEIYSNWKNKMLHACEINSPYLSFVTMAYSQEFYDEMAQTYNIPKIDFIGEFKSDDLFANVVAFENALSEWKKLYDKFNKPIIKFDNLESLDMLYKK